MEMQGLMRKVKISAAMLTKQDLESRVHSHISLTFGHVDLLVHKGEFGVETCGAIPEMAHSPFCTIKKMAYPHHR